MRTLRTLDVITSAYNEEECIEELYNRIAAVMARYNEIAWQLYICDNASTDSTWQHILNLSNIKPNVTGFRMSRTFPFDAGLTVGLNHATAEAAIIMASDLQDPPEIFPEFIDGYQSGFDQVVVRILKKNQVPFLRRILSGFFYKFANRMTNNLIPRGVSDFRLISKPVYVATRQMTERNRFLRGIIAWTGFNVKVIEIDRPPRFAGESKYDKIKLSKVINWATSSILTYTSAPLTWLAVYGVFSSIFSFLSTIFLALLWILQGVPFAGFGTLVALISLGFSITMLALGIISQYLALVYEEVKARPIYLLAETTQKID